eukprot:scaffold2076_cov99-Amphora_coffeaeformis.AAC.1
MAEVLCGNQSESVLKRTISKRPGSSWIHAKALVQVLVLILIPLALDRGYYHSVVEFPRKEARLAGGVLCILKALNRTTSEKR